MADFPATTFLSQGFSAVIKVRGKIVEAEAVGKYLPPLDVIGFGFLE